MTKIEYQIVTGRGEDIFERKIARALDDGWVPHGGVSIAYPTTCFDADGVRVATFAQAFTRPKAEKTLAPGLFMRGGGILRRIRGVQ